MSGAMIGAACYVAWNEATLIAESIRSVKAYVDRFVVIDGAFSTNPAPGPVASTDGMREVVERACTGSPLTYIVPPARLEEHVARNACLAELEADEWALVIDADEILTADHDLIRRHLAHLPRRGIVELPIYTTAVLFAGNADAMSPAEYEMAPVIATRGYMPRLLRAASDLHYQRDEVAPGVFTHCALWRGSELAMGPRWPGVRLINRHVAQPFEGYLADYAWETAQRDGAR